MNSVMLTVIVVSLTVVPLVWTLLAKDPKSASDFRAAPSSFSGMMIVISVIGTIIGGAMFVAVGQIGFEAGIVGFVLGVVYLLGFLMFGLNAAAVSKVMAESRVEALVDLIEIKYSKRMAGLFAATNFVMYLILLSSQFVIASTFYYFLSDKGVQPAALVIMLTAAFVTIAAYSWLGGIRKDIRTDVLQVIIIIFSLVTIIYLMGNSMPAGAVIKNLPDDHLSGIGYGWIFTIALFVFIGPMIFVRPDIWQRAVALREQRQMTVVFAGAGVVSFVAFSLFTYLGMWSRVNFSEAPPASATLEAIWAVSTGSGILGLIIGGLFAAILSSADTLVNNAAVHLEKSLRLFRGSGWENEWASDDKRTLFVLKVSSLGVLVVAGVVAMLVQDVVDLITASFSVLLIFLPAIVGLLRSRKINESVAFYTSILGLARVCGV